jgi:hypothetical protein
MADGRNIEHASPAAPDHNELIEIGSRRVAQLSLCFEMAAAVVIPSTPPAAPSAGASGSSDSNTPSAALVIALQNKVLSSSSNEEPFLSRTGMLVLAPVHTDGSGDAAVPTLRKISQVDSWVVYEIVEFSVREPRAFVTLVYVGVIGAPVPGFEEHAPLQPGCFVDIPRPRLAYHAC